MFKGALERGLFGVVVPQFLVGVDHEREGLLDEILTVVLPDAVGLHILTIATLDSVPFVRLVPQVLVPDSNSVMSLSYN